MGGKKRAQVSFEYVFLAAISIALIVPLLYFLLSNTLSPEKDTARAVLTRFSSELIQNANEIYYSGKYGKRTLNYALPGSVQYIYVEAGHNLIFANGNGSSEEILHSTYSPVPLKVVGFDNKERLPLNFILIKGPGVDYVLICTEDTCESQYCPDSKFAVTYCRDLDSDGFGDQSDSTESCSPVAGYVADCLDCDDSLATGAGINPGAAEICGNGIDEDCDGVDC